MDRIKKVETFIRGLPPRSVVAIDGYSGSGKTRLLRALARLNRNILAVHLDDFLNTGKKRRALLKTARDPSVVFELHWNNVEKVQRLLRAYRIQSGSYSVGVYNSKTDRYDKKRVFDLSKKVLVLEGIFLLHPKLYPHTFDATVYLDIDLKVAKARRMQREKRRWGRAYVPEDRPDSFFRLFTFAYTRYVKQYRPKKIADLVVKVV